MSAHSEKVQIDQGIINWLLDPKDPALRYKVFTQLLDIPENQPQAQEARWKILQQEWIKAILAGHNGDGTWSTHMYQKYRGTSWVLLHLSEMGVTAEIKPVAKGIDFLQSSAKPVSKLKGREAQRFSGCADGQYWYYPIPCLAANMVTVLCRNGQENHPLTKGALSLCSHLFDPEQGFDCQVMDHSLLPGCVMAVPLALRAFLSIPAPQRSPQDFRMIKALIRLLKKFDLYRYVAADTREWYQWAHKASA